MVSPFDQQGRLSVAHFVGGVRPYLENQDSRFDGQKIFFGFIKVSGGVEGNGTQQRRRIFLDTSLSMTGVTDIVSPASARDGITLRIKGRPSFWREWSDFAH